MAAPCKNCERKGCGAYHDRCPIYLEWKEEKAKEDQKEFDLDHKKRRLWR